MDLTKKLSVLLIAIFCFASSCSFPKSGVENKRAGETGQVDGPEFVNESEPPITNQIITIGPDPLASQSWHLNNTGQDSFANNGGVAGEDINDRLTFASGVSGEGVKIAISDNGTEINHEDLWNNHLTGQSRNYTSSSPSNWVGGSNPAPSGNSDNDAHGTAVTGLITGMRNNSIGSLGVAYNAGFAAFKYIGTSPSVAKDIDQANGNFDIFNFSYGRNSCSFVELPSSYIAQLRHGVTSLRSGKGAVYIKAAGNEYSSRRSDCGVSSNDPYYGNANLEAEHSTGYVLVVGANNSRGISAGYSTPGSSLWISAPGGDFGVNFPAMISTDLMGCDSGMASVNDGANDFDKGQSSLNESCHYTSSMNGTSSAAPIVSGAVALLLEVNPELTWRDIRYILAKSARKIDPQRGVSSHPAGANLNGHDYLEGWTTNSAGFHFHNWYGFGALDVDAAIQLARNYNLSFLGAFQEGDWLNDSGNIDLDIPDNSSIGVSHSQNISEDIVIESVQVRVTVDHTYAGDLGIELVAPSGTKSQLMLINSNILESSLNDVLLLSNAFYGESSNGQWSLRIIDGADRDTGSLKNWKINFQGHSSNNQTATTLATSNQQNYTRQVASLKNEKSKNSQDTAIEKSTLITISKSNVKDAEAKQRRGEGYLIRTNNFSISKKNKFSLKTVSTGKQVLNFLTKYRDQKDNLHFLFNDGTRDLLVSYNSLGDEKRKIQIKERGVTHLSVSSDMKYLVSNAEKVFGLDIDGKTIWSHDHQFDKVLSLANIKGTNLIIGRGFNKDYVSGMLLSSDGLIIDEIKWKLSEFERIESVVLDKNNNVFFYGHSKVNKLHLMITKANFKGEILQSRVILKNSLKKSARKFAVSNDGDIYLGFVVDGDLYESHGGGKDLALIKLSDQFDVIWKKQFGKKTIGLGSIGDEELHEIFIDKNGMIHLLAETDDNFYGVNSGGRDLVSLSFSEHGKLINLFHASYDKFGEEVEGDDIPLALIFSNDKKKSFLINDNKVKLIEVYDSSEDDNDKESNSLE